MCFIWILKIWPGTWWPYVELGLRPPQPPPKGCSANMMKIIWNLPQLFEMQGASYHWSLDQTHILLNIKYGLPTHLWLFDLKLFLYHSVLLNYSSLFLPCLLNATEKLVWGLSISHICVKSNFPFNVLFCGLLHNFWTIRRWFCPCTINSLAQLYELHKSYKYNLGNSTLAAFTLQRKPNH
jgi:hypothetical protein